MKLLKAELIRLADMKLEAAKEKHGLNHSDHESYAVLLKEVEETRREMKRVEVWLASLWENIKIDVSPEENRKSFAGIYDYSISLAAEAVQCAAMARKGLISNIENNKKKRKG